MTVTRRRDLSALLYAFIWGGLWGIFEATAGYILHLLSFSIGWLIWYPSACFFMAMVYRATRKPFWVLLSGLICASLKLVNLLLPARIDQIINPAVSIVFEALTVAMALFLYGRLSGNKRSRALAAILGILGMNTGWRVLYCMYLLFLVPDWIREISVISGEEQFISFFITQNLLTCLPLIAGLLLKPFILRPVIRAERKLSQLQTCVPSGAVPAIRTAIAVLVISLSVVLEYLL